VQKFQVNDENVNLIESACKNLGYITGIQKLDSTQSSLNQVVPQLKAKCATSGAEFPCFIEVLPNPIMHEKDL